jgi:hypothetical protein
MDQKRYDRAELERMSDDALSDLDANSSSERTKKLIKAIRKERNPTPLTPDQELARDAAIEKAKIKQQASTDAIAQAQKSLQASLPEREYRALVANNMLSERTPAQIRAYTKAAVSWQSHDPSRAAIDHAVASLKSFGIEMQERGQNGSWYGNTEDGKSVRVADHLGFEAHDIDLVFPAEVPMDRATAIAYMQSEWEGR